MSLGLSGGKGIVGRHRGIHAIAAVGVQREAGQRSGCLHKCADRTRVDHVDIAIRDQITRRSGAFVHAHRSKRNHRRVIGALHNEGERGGRGQTIRVDHVIGHHDLGLVAHIEAVKTCIGRGERQERIEDFDAADLSNGLAVDREGDIGDIQLAKHIVDVRGLLQKVDAKGRPAFGCAVDQIKGHLGCVVYPRDGDCGGLRHRVIARDHVKAYVEHRGLTRAEEVEIRPVIGNRAVVVERDQRCVTGCRIGAHGDRQGGIVNRGRFPVVHIRRRAQQRVKEQREGGRHSRIAFDIRGRCVDHDHRGIIGAGDRDIDRRRGAVFGNDVKAVAQRVVFRQSLDQRIGIVQIIGPDAIGANGIAAVGGGAGGHLEDVVIIGRIHIRMCGRAGGQSGGHTAFVFDSIACERTADHGCVRQRHKVQRRRGGDRRRAVRHVKGKGHIRVVIRSRGIGPGAIVVINKRAQPGVDLQVFGHQHTGISKVHIRGIGDQNVLIDDDAWRVLIHRLQHNRCRDLRCVIGAVDRQRDRFRQCVDTRCDGKADVKDCRLVIVEVVKIRLVIGDRAIAVHRDQRGHRRGRGTAVHTHNQRPVIQSRSFPVVYICGRGQQIVEVDRHAFRRIGIALSIRNRVGHSDRWRVIGALDRNRRCLIDRQTKLSAVRNLIGDRDRAGLACGDAVKGRICRVNRQRRIDKRHPSWCCSRRSPPVDRVHHVLSAQLAEIVVHIRGAIQQVNQDRCAVFCPRSAQAAGDPRRIVQRKDRDVQGLTVAPRGLNREAVGDAHLVAVAVDAHAIRCQGFDGRIFIIDVINPGAVRVERQRAVVAHNCRGDPGIVGIGVVDVVVVQIATNGVIAEVVVGAALLGRKGSGAASDNCRIRRAGDGDHHLLRDAVVRRAGIVRGGDVIGQHQIIAIIEEVKDPSGCGKAPVDGARGHAVDDSWPCIHAHKAKQGRLIQRAITHRCTRDADRRAHGDADLVGRIHIRHRQGTGAGDRVVAFADGIRSRVARHSIDADLGRVVGARHREGQSPPCSVIRAIRGGIFHLNRARFTRAKVIIDRRRRVERDLACGIVIVKAGQSLRRRRAIDRDVAKGNIIKLQHIVHIGRQIGNRDVARVGTAKELAVACAFVHRNGHDMAGGHGRIVGAGDRDHNLIRSCRSAIGDVHVIGDGHRVAIAQPVQRIGRGIGVGDVLIGAGGIATVLDPKGDIRRRNQRCKICRRGGCAALSGRIDRRPVRADRGRQRIGIHRSTDKGAALIAVLHRQRAANRDGLRGGIDVFGHTRRVSDADNHRRIIAAGDRDGDRFVHCARAIAVGDQQIIGLDDGVIFGQTVDDAVIQYKGPFNLAYAIARRDIRKAALQGSDIATLLRLDRHRVHVVDLGIGKADCTGKAVLCAFVARGFGELVNGRCNIGRPGNLRRVVGAVDGNCDLDRFAVVEGVDDDAVGQLLTIRKTIDRVIAIVDLVGPSTIGKHIERAIAICRTTDRLEGGFCIIHIRNRQRSLRIWRGVGHHRRAVTCFGRRSDRIAPQRRIVVRSGDVDSNRVRSAIVALHGDGVLQHVTSVQRFDSGIVVVQIVGPGAISSDGQRAIGARNRICRPKIIGIARIHIGVVDIATGRVRTRAVGHTALFGDRTGIAGCNDRGIIYTVDRDGHLLGGANVNAIECRDIIGQDQLFTAVDEVELPCDRVKAPASRAILIAKVGDPA